MQKMPIDFVPFIPSSLPFSVLKNPFMHPVQAEDISCHKFAVVFQQNVEMVRGMESVSHLLCAFRVHNVEIFQRTHKSTELVPAQDIEIDCFGFEESQ